MTELPYGRTTEPRHVISLTSVDSDELVQPPFKLERKYNRCILLRVLCLEKLQVAIQSLNIQATSIGSDQIARMQRFRWPGRNIRCR